MLTSKENPNLAQEIGEIRPYTHQVLTNLLLFDGDLHMWPRSLKETTEQFTEVKWFSNL